MNQSEYNRLQKQGIINGCGGKGSGFTPPYAIFFKASCNKHDELYSKGGNEIDRKIADVYLLEYMKLDASRVEILGKRLFYFCWCYIYYIAVRKGGKKYFNYK